MILYSNLSLRKILTRSIITTIENHFYLRFIRIKHTEVFHSHGDDLPNTTLYKFLLLDFQWQVQMSTKFVSTWFQRFFIVVMEISIVLKIHFGTLWFQFNKQLIRIRRLENMGYGLRKTLSNHLKSRLFIDILFLGFNWKKDSWGFFCKSLIGEIDILNKDYYYLRK